MKAGFIFILFSIFAAVLQARPTKVSVLFIGNSYTAVNNLPLLVDSIASAAGDTLEWDMAAPGGYTFALHSADVNTLAKIHQRSWDYVVLQEQSQLPSFEPASVDSTTIPFALFLDSVIHASNACTQTVFYETWGRKYGDAANCAFYPPVCTYAGMQQRLLESYKLMADTCHGIVAPVGEAFRNCIAYDSTVNLYQSDFSHPSLQGSFLAASVFYNIFFHRSAAGNSYNPGTLQLTPGQFHLLARETVSDSLNFWNLGIFEPWAEFAWTEAPGCVAEFSGNSNLNFNHLWDFGDSTTSSDPNPVHHYLYSGYYPVIHVVYDSCSSDTFLLTNNMLCNGASVDDFHSVQFQLFPSPANDQLVIARSDESKVFLKIFNAFGQLMVQGQYTGSLIHVPVASLPAGIYYLRIADGYDLFSSRKFIVAR